MTIPAAILIALSVVLMVSAGVALYALLRGCQVLRRLVRAAWDDDSILLKSPMAPGISVITSPADASPESRAWVRELLELHYGSYEVVVVLDGPEPLERDRWLAEFRLGPSSRDCSGELKAAPVRGVYESYDPIQLVLVDKEPGGLGDALNAGVNAARFPVIGQVDRFSRFTPNLLLRLVRPMLEKPEETVAVCGLAPAPAPGGWAARFAACAFLRNWLVRCAAFRGWNLLLPVPDAAVLVRRDAVMAAHGFRGGMADLCLRLHAAARSAEVPYRVALVPDPVVLPARVSNWRELGRETARDQEELSRLWIRWPRGTARRVRAGVLWYRLFQPLLEIAGYPLALAGWILGWLDAPTALFFLVASAGTGLVVSTAAVVLPALVSDRGPDPAQIKQLFVAAIVENLGYRQLRNLYLVWGFVGRGN